ncbi:MAG: molybdenum cofactor guanylyltransferase [Nitrospirota bacterium]|nr:molybdenum cofactor guanylyltransferase [Nitrospirota bacterium]MDE3226680.1 molybdenum cofactor guanylyltransferase [Nitrospirota bacterium]
MGATIGQMTGLLLAGGKSRRMGRDKRFLELGGRTLLERSLSVLDSLFAEVIVSVAEPLPELRELRARVVTDIIPDCATLGGLYTGLFSSSYPRVFAAACDMPFLAVPLIQRMIDLGRDADVVMVRLANGLQPMHAIYSKACLPHLEQMLRVKNLRVQELLSASGLSVKILSEDDVRDADPQLLSFLNVNQPADLEFARKLLAGKQETAGNGE